MHSRSYLFIEKEIQLFKDYYGDQGIEIRKIYSDDEYNWIARVTPLTHPPWQSGVFDIAINFSPCFNEEAPILYFVTIPYHPNVDPDSGLIGIDSIFEPGGLWRDGRKQCLGNLLLQVLSLLYEPNLDCILNAEAAFAYLNNRVGYDVTVRECVIASRALLLGETKGKDLSVNDYDSYLSVAPKSKDPEIDSHMKRIYIEYDSNYDKLVAEREKQSHFAPKVTKVDFDSYWITWKGIATSKPSFDNNNPYLMQLKTTPEFIPIHHGRSTGLTEKDLKEKVKQHHLLKYGMFTKKEKAEQVDHHKSLSQRLERIEKMRKIFLKEKSSSSISLRDARVKTNTAKTSGSAGFLNAPVNDIYMQSSSARDRSFGMPDETLWNTARSQPSATDEEEEEEEEEEDVDELLKWSENLQRGDSKLQ